MPASGYYRFITPLIAVLFCCCGKPDNKNLLFQSVSSKQTGVEFSNDLEEGEQFNIIEYLYFYNGGGVAIGDINNDQLPDIYFSSNQQSNKLYLNKGNLSFEDITTRAGAQGLGNWKTGVTMADVNGDGFLDIFSCGVSKYKNFDGKNQLLINNGDLTFTDQATAVGLTFQGLSTQASFFDFDRDGDLDMYLLNHSVHTVRSYGDASLRYQSDPIAGDRFYRNELAQEGKLRFTDITETAGIFSSHIGYGLAVGVSDVNNDGYPDIYVSNDFHENDYLYINQGDGTFKEKLASSMAHTSRFSMGNTLLDLNNDLRVDIITLDMFPYDEKVIKTTAGEDNYEILDFKQRYGYHYQVTRNAFQLNQGVNSNGDVLFSDIAPFAKMEATDWSWAPLVADFDQDGLKDLVITNGIKKRPNDLDYINYISDDSVQLYGDYEQMIAQMPDGKVSSFFFKNQNGISFADSTASWSEARAKLTNGAAYGDLDNDGDLDLVFNHLNEKAEILENTLAHHNFIKVSLKGNAPNRWGVGAKIFLFASGKRQLAEQLPNGGWLSANEPILHFGLGAERNIDSLTVVWPRGQFQTLRNISAGQTIIIHENEADRNFTYETGEPSTLLAFTGELEMQHEENNFSAFSKERLMPRMVSTLGPLMSTGDVNGDGLDDVFIGNAKGRPGHLLIQQVRGFTKLVNADIINDSIFEDVGSVFVDVNGDKHRDLVVASGGGEDSVAKDKLTPRLYLNNGRGKFRKHATAFQNVATDASCVKALDLDSDGDMDLFLGGRVVAGAYGVAATSFILINDGKGNFTSVDRLPGGGRLGMVSDAAWTDLNKDKRPDLIVVGEWMPITVLLQDASGRFIDRTEEYGMRDTKGWWNVISTTDTDGDGDSDFIVGNAGLNSRLRASRDEPVRLYVGDFDTNGSTDHVMTYFNQGTETPFLTREQLVKQLPHMKRKFLRHQDFARITKDDIIPPEKRDQTLTLTVTTFSSVAVINDGDRFKTVSLPDEAQFFPIFAVCREDLNRDGTDDLIVGGNFYGIQPDIGRSDAGFGLVLLGARDGSFKPLTVGESGFMVKGEVRSIGSVQTRSGERMFVVGKNNGNPVLFRLQPPSTTKK